MATNFNNPEFTRRKRKDSNPDLDLDHDHDHDMLTLSLSMPHVHLPSSNSNTNRGPPPPLNFSPARVALPQPPLPPPVAVTPPFISPEPIQQLPPPSFFNTIGIFPTSSGGSDVPYIFPPVSTTISSSPTTAVYRPAEVFRPAVPSRRTRQKRSPAGNDDTIPPPYPWATDKKAVIHTFNELRSREISKISGQVKCKTCFEIYEMEFDLEEKINEVARYVATNKDSMRDRAPGKWINPDLPPCKLCGQENAMKPVISEDLQKVNWLFLLLGEMIGLCKLEQLKYLCKNTKNHCTGAKDRLVYLVYLTLCHQLFPDGPFQLR